MNLTGGQIDDEQSARMKVLKFIYGDLSPAKLQDLKKACQQEVT